MKKLLILISLTFFIITNSFAQLGEIKGIIKDDMGPLPGVTVYIEVGGEKHGTSTDANGKYTIKPVKSGTHAVFATYVGYKPMKIYDVLVTSGDIAYVNVDMEAAATTIGEFVLVEKMHEIPLINKGEPGVQHVLPKSFQRDPNRNNPIVAIAGLTAGVQLAPNGKDVMIRGARPTSTQFITDGVKSRTGDIGIPGLAVGSVKVYTSGIPSAYGDVTGGVIVVETKSYFDLAQKFK
jgi:hypothetical protein